MEFLQDDTVMVITYRDYQIQLLDFALILWLQILLVLGDLNNEETCNAMVDKTIEKFGCLNVVVSCELNPVSISFGLLT